MYEKYIETLEGLDTSGFSMDQNEAMEVAKDSMAFVTALNDAFIKNGSIKEQDPNLPALESMIDSLVTELFAAVMLLCQFKGPEDRLRQTAKELTEAKLQGQAEFVDDQAIRGYSKLADRIEASRKRLDKLNV